MKSTQGIIKADWYIVLLALLTIAITAILLYSAFKPFSPYRMYDYGISHAGPVCVGDVVQVYVDREVDGGHYSVRVDGSWHKMDSTYFLETPDGVYNVDYEDKTKERAYSGLLQPTPPSPGVWQFQAEVTVNGRVGVLPRQQDVREIDSKPINILSTYDKHCKGE
jgi:hypothetical protein